MALLTLTGHIMPNRSASNPCSILPATDCLFNKAKVKIAEVMKMLGGGQILICEREVSFGAAPKKYFLSSAGDLGFKVNDSLYGRHDQTWRPMGKFTIIGVVNYKVVAGLLNIESVETIEALSDFSTINAPVAVFK